MPTHFPRARKLIAALTLAVGAGSGLPLAWPAAATPAGAASTSTTTATTTTVPVAAAGSTGADEGAAASAEGDSALLLEIAQLTDQIQTAEERIAVDQVHKAVDALQLQEAQRTMRTDAVDAYISGGQPTTPLSFMSPSPVPRYYTDLAMQHQQAVVATLHRAEIKADQDEQADQSDYRTLSSLNSELDQERAALEARVVTDTGLQIQEQDVLARAEALQQEEAEQQAADNSAAFAGDTAPSGSDVAATQSQQTLMSEYPFGPLTAAQLAQYGLAETGQVVSGVASWYGPGFDGRPTASGAIYDENEYTCASPNLPFGTMLLVTAANGSAGVLVDVNDRGPYVAGRVLDLSHAAAEAIGSTGLINVNAYVVAPTS